MGIDSKRVIAGFEAVAADRELVKNLWADVSYLVDPGMSTEESGSKGRDRSVRMFNSTAMEAHSRLVTTLFSSMTPLNLEWVHLQPLGRGREGEEEGLWLDDASNLCMSIFRSPNSGFGSGITECFQSVTSFGITTLSTFFDGIIRYRSLPPGEIYPQANQYGKLDTMYRLKHWTPIQAAEKFGRKNLPKDLRKTLDKPGANVETDEYIHVVMPREQASLSKISRGNNKRYVSAYLDRKTGHVLRESGFDRNPYATARWAVNSGENLGTSPAIKVIDKIRSSNIAEEAAIRTMQKIGDPTFLIEDDTVIGRFVSAAGAVNTKRRGSTIDTVPVGDPTPTLAYLERIEEFIGKSFFADIAQIPLQDRMTATEIIERRQDQLSVLSPYNSRLEEELLGPTIMNTLAISIAQGALRPPPDSLVESNISIEYVSPLAISQKMGRVQAFNQWSTIILGMAQAIAPSNPRAAKILTDKIKTENVPDFVAKALNVAQELIRSDDEVQAMQESSDQQQEIGSALEAGGKAAEIAVDVAKANSIAGRIGA